MFGSRRWELLFLVLGPSGMLQAYDPFQSLMQGFGCLGSSLGVSCPFVMTAAAFSPVLACVLWLRVQIMRRIQNEFFFNAATGQEPRRPSGWPF